MDRKSIEKPFDKNLHKRLPNTGAVYVEGAEYIRRLNNATDGDWSFEIAQYQVHEKAVVVMGRLTHAGLIKEAFGGAQIKRSRKTGEALSLGDDLKAAATDALKKAATLFGLGLEIHSKDFEPSVDEGEAAPAPRAQPQASRGDDPHPKGRGITRRQVAALAALQKQLGWDADALSAALKTDPMMLDRDGAQAGIESLQKMILDRGEAA